MCRCINVLAHRFNLVPQNCRPLKLQFSRQVSCNTQKTWYALFTIRNAVRYWCIGWIELRVRKQTVKNRYGEVDFLHDDRATGVEIRSG